VTLCYIRWPAACAECLRVRQAVAPGTISIFFLFLLLTDVPKQAFGMGFDLQVLMRGAMPGASEARPGLPRYRSRSFRSKDAYARHNGTAPQAQASAARTDGRTGQRSADGVRVHGSGVRILNRPGVLP
jgi:hypothetical protein